MTDTIVTPVDPALEAARILYFSTIPEAVLIHSSIFGQGTGRAASGTRTGAPAGDGSSGEALLAPATYMMAYSTSSQGITINGDSYVLTFADEFNGSTVSFWTGFGSGGIWATSFSPHLDDTRTIAANGELQYYADQDMAGLPSPFTLSEGVLTIHASELDQTQQQLTGGLDYVSGLISTEMTFSTSSGYIEISADVPDQTGFWSAFWLMPADGDWSAEIDIFEILGEDAGTLHTNVWDDGSPNADYVTDTGAGDGFHTYGLFWDADTIQWYYDGAMIREADNTVTEDMFLIINLAVGGWASDPDATTDFSDGLSIDYVRVYELDSDPDRNPEQLSATFVPAGPDVGSSASEAINGSHFGDLINGLEGNDTLYGKDGDDSLSGGPGDDRIFGQDGDDVLYGNDGNDHLIGGAGADTLEGGAGTDHMWGGPYGADGSRDSFVFSDGSGTDYIHDFEAGIDVIDLSAFNTDWTATQSALSDQTWAVRLDLQALGGSGGDVVYLADVAIQDLDSSSFLFA
ncbi:family 16 glycosylhydrolase [Mangrovicoccus ximenensis]|uniref:family 16 glycosylhydrolase n=1 Tax=Mangrovicoccus ximenensis TaxID=1911570 RepID=UPI000D36F6BF|nr:family 16 glycosylhydrolase [Mangrovicoccus ximenensis]